MAKMSAKEKKNRQAVKMITPLIPVPAATGHVKTHPQFPMPAVNGCEKA